MNSAFKNQNNAIHAMVALVLAIAPAMAHVAFGNANVQIALRPGEADRRGIIGGQTCTRMKNGVQARLASRCLQRTPTCGGLPFARCSGDCKTCDAVSGDALVNDASGFEYKLVDGICPGTELGECKRTSPYSLDFCRCIAAAGERPRKIMCGTFSAGQQGDCSGSY
jgi:hypothetical protein